MNIFSSVCSLPTVVEEVVDIGDNGGTLYAVDGDVAGASGG